MKEGMYLRHGGLWGDFPIIQKIEKLASPGRCGGKYKVFTDKCDDWYIDSDYIELNNSKYSFDIIDLICVGDLMFIDISPDDYGGIVVPRIAETLNEGKEYHDKLKSGEYILKGIITKEQLENMTYWVGDTNVKD